jgi:predicted deoxyguanosinetriphosphate triphosphohydrolase
LSLYERFSVPAISKAPAAHDPRSPVAKDRDRIIHSSAFRRLQGKSQIVGVEVGDFFRTRITHTIECAQIGRGIATAVAANEWHGVVERAEDFPDVVEAACLAHDLGHAPFGHNGEQVLSAMMRKHNSSLFEGNAQSFRIVTQLESKANAPTKADPSKERWLGLDLTRATLRALMKYTELESRSMLKVEHATFGCYDDKADREYYEWVWEGAKNPPRTVAAAIMDTADDIAYAVHDFEDGVWAGMIPLQALLNEHDYSVRLLTEKVRQRDRKELFTESDLTSTFAALFIDEEVAPKLEYLRTIGYDRTREARAELKNYTAWLIGELMGAVTAGGSFVEPVGDVARRIAMLKAFAWQWMIERTDIETIQFGPKRLVQRIFEGYCERPEMLPRREEWQVIKSKSTKRQRRGWVRWPEKIRHICDHIAGMTDGYAMPFTPRCTEARNTEICTSRTEVPSDPSRTLGS